MKNQKMKRARVVSGAIFTLIGLLLIASMAIKVSVPVVAVGFVAAAFGIFTIIRNTGGSKSERKTTTDEEFTL